MMGNGQETIEMVTDNKIGRTGPSMKDTGKITKVIIKIIFYIINIIIFVQQMERVNFIMQMGNFYKINNLFIYFY